MAMLGWSELYYKDVASLLLRLALTAPGGRPDLLVHSADGPDGPRAAGAPVRARPRPAPGSREPGRPRPGPRRQGAITRFANFFAAVHGGDTSEGGWSFENVDFAYFRAPYLAERDDADSCMRLLLEDFAHYATLRKPRRGEDAVLVFDEFSAIAGGREAAISSPNASATPAARCTCPPRAPTASETRPSSGGWSAPARAACSSTPCPTRTRCCRGRGGQGGRADLAARLGRPHRQQLGADRAAADRGRRRAAGPRGEAWFIARGRYEHLMVARTAIPDAYRARAHAIVALARSLQPVAAIPERAAGPRSKRPPAASWWASAATWRSTRPQPASHPAEADSHGGAPLVAGHRLRLAVITAARDADVPATAALIRQGQRQGLDPSWLLAVAARHWPPPRLAVRAGSGRAPLGSQRRRWAWARRPRRRAVGRWPAGRHGRGPATQGCRRGATSPLRCRAGTPTASGGPARPGGLPAGRAATPRPGVSRVAHVHGGSLRPAAGPSTQPAGSWPGDTRSPGAGEGTARPAVNTPTRPARRCATRGRSPDHHRDRAASTTKPKEANVMPDTHVTISGNLTDDPEVSFTRAGRRCATSGWPSPRESRTGTAGRTATPASSGSPPGGSWPSTSATRCPRATG